VRNRRAESAEVVHRVTHERVDAWVAGGVPESFVEHTDAQRRDVARQRAQVRAYVDVALARIDTIAARQDVEQSRHVFDRAAHRAEMIDAGIDAHCAGVRDEPVGRLEADDAAVRRGDADRTALVAADREVSVAGRDHDATAARRSATRPRRIVRVAHGTGRSRVAPCGYAQVLADCLADDLAAGGEDPPHDGRVDVRDVITQRRRAVHHRDAGERDVVLQRDGASREGTDVRLTDRAAPAPRAERVVRGRRFVTPVAP
jgi:hypothetical protein